MQLAIRVAIGLALENSRRSPASHPASSTFLILSKVAPMRAILDLTFVKTSFISLGTRAQTAVNNESTLFATL